jgi:transcriptional regulator with XRE-family HTH domain
MARRARNVEAKEEGTGARLREIRLRAGMKAMDLAKRMGVSQGHLSRIETGKQAVRSEVLVKLAKVLGVKPADFFVETPEGGVPKVGKPLKTALAAPEFVSVASRMAGAYLRDKGNFSSMVAVTQALLKK